MKVSYGNGKTEYGPGVDIKLTGDEVAEAIDLWIARTGRCIISGPRTITVNGRRCEYGLVYVDPSGSVKSEDGYLSMNGAGEITPRLYGNEYKLYCDYMKGCTTQNPKNYTDWADMWETETQARRQAILLKYAEFLGYAVEPISIKKETHPVPALCFSVDVGANS